jgi:hypothetical protein
MTFVSDWSIAAHPTQRSESRTGNAFSTAILPGPRKRISHFQTVFPNASETC